MAFLVEMMLRVIAAGPAVYLQSKWNTFDGAVVVAGLIGYFYKSAAGLSIFRTVRLVRRSLLLLLDCTHVSFS